MSVGEIPFGSAQSLPKGQGLDPGWAPCGQATAGLPCEGRPLASLARSVNANRMRQHKG